jgi:dipeptidase E
MIRHTGGVGIAVENNCAIEFVDGFYKVIRSNSYARAYRLYKDGAEVIAKQIPQRTKISPADPLQRKSSM